MRYDARPSSAALGLLLATLPALGAAQPTPRRATPVIDSIFAARMADVDIVGAAAAIIVDRKVVWMKGYGFANVERTRPFTEHTIMGVASIAKPFVGVSMMRAVREGRLSLDEDINRYLPFRVVNPYHPRERITLRQIATHTSSITDRQDVYRASYHFGGDSPDTLSRFLEAYFAPGGRNYARANFLDARPGTQRDYCNICAGLAGFIVERAFNEPLSTYTKKHIFMPLGMASTGWFLREVDLANHSTHFVAQNGTAIPIAHYATATYPDGGLRTSVADLSRFFVAMLDDGEVDGVRILDSTMAAEMTRFQFDRAHHPANFPTSEGNSGLFWRTKFNGTRVGHGGNDPGISTDMLADVPRRNGIILFLNTSVAGTDARASSAMFDAVWTQMEAWSRAPR